MNKSSIIASVVMKMPLEKQKIFQAQFEQERKSIYVSYFLLLGLGGMHYFYLKETRIQIYYILSWVCLLGGFWWLFDCFRMPKLVDDFNVALAKKIICTLEPSLIQDFEKELLSTSVDSEKSNSSKSDDRILQDLIKNPKPQEDDAMQMTTLKFGDDDLKAIKLVKRGDCTLYVYKEKSNLYYGKFESGEEVKREKMLDNFNYQQTQLEQLLMGMGLTSAPSDLLEQIKNTFKGDFDEPETFF